MASGHSYSDIHVGERATVHNGDVYGNVQNIGVQYRLLPEERIPVEIEQCIGMLQRLSSLSSYGKKLESHAYQHASAAAETAWTSFDVEALKRENEEWSGIITQVYSAVCPGGAGKITAHELLSDKRTGDLGTDDQNMLAVRAAVLCYKSANNLLETLDLLYEAAQLVKAGTLDTIRPVSRSSQSNVLSLQASIRECQADLGDANEGLPHALRAAVRAQHVLLAEPLMKSLSFDGMETREDIIVNAYPQTCNWAVNDESFGLRTWLRHGDGIFWITGKAGSGKSTLLKYLYHSEETTFLLRSWAGDLDVVITRFYFWYLGTNMQKSIEGLLRSILKQLLIEFPQYAREAAALHTAGGKSDNMSWRFERLFDLLQWFTGKLASGEDAKKLCFFIDGLDEYNGDHLQLLRALDTMSKSLHIKLCLSSRSWSIFARAYERKVPNLRLEDLTNAGIFLYTHETVLRAISAKRDLFFDDDDDDDDDAEYSPEAIRQLVQEVTDKAEGVFLWVYLVVNNLKKGIVEGDPISVLHDRLVSFPADLNTFFRTLIYERLDPIYVRQTSQALYLAFKYARDRRGFNRYVSFIDYWLILQNLDGVVSLEAASGLAKYDNPDLGKLYKQTRNALSSVCRDLLVIEPTKKPGVTTTVSFLHRTVFDFLSNDNMHHDLAERAGEAFQSDRIFYLLAFSKARIFVSFRLERYGWDLTEICLRGRHEDLCEQYVSTMAAVLRTQLGVRTEFPSCHPKALWTLIVFQCSDVATSYLSRDQDWSPDVLSLLVAAIGCSTLNTFELGHANIKLVTRLCQLLKSGMTNEPTTDCHEPDCALTVWGAFLRKSHFYLTTEQLRDGAIEDGKEPTVLVMEMANLFLKSGASPEQQFCIARHSYDEAHEHEWCGAMALFEKHFDFEPRRRDSIKDEAGI